jgi:HPt (histidine-containing phosphotransfer) domain-containing protein
MLDFSKISTIKEIDMSAGLKLVSDMEDVYIDILETFAEEFDEKISAILTSCESENFEYFDIYIHGMKSSLQYIGASLLAREAYEIELAFKNKDTDVSLENISSFIDRLKQLNINLKSIM